MLDNILHWIDNSISPQVHIYRAATQGKLCQYTQLTMEWTCLDHYTTKYANVSTKFKEPHFLGAKPTSIYGGKCQSSHQQQVEKMQGNSPEKT